MASENQQKLVGEADNDPEAENSVYADGDTVRPEFVQKINNLLEEGKSGDLLALIDPLHESELGDVLEALGADERARLVELTGGQFDYAALTEVDEAIRLEMVNAIPNEQIAKAVEELDSDDAVYILEDLDEGDREEILQKLPFTERLKLRRSLNYPDETAGRRMQTEFIAVPPFWTVGQTIDFMRDDDDLPDRFHEIFVVDPTFELKGSVALDRLLRTQRKVRIDEIMGDSIHPIDAAADQEEAARVFERYDLVSAAVVDDAKRLVGVLTHDDIMDVIHQEADEDIKRLAGVGDEELSDDVLNITQSRFTWLFVNLITAVLASIVIGLFERTLQSMVALAVLMPIVASMGGNAGTQSMTVAVRAIAMRDIDAYNMLRTIRREFLVGLLNGIVFAILMGLIAIYWFDNQVLGIIIGLAMIVNMICAALAGILIPLALNKAGADPAISSSVFVTTVTDVVGFFAFLGCAAWWFGF